jgi:hypothetical protein
MIAGSTLITLLVTLVIAGLIFWLLWWFLGVCGLPEPFNKVARIVVALVAVVYLIDMLMGLNGHPLLR